MQCCDCLAARTEALEDPLHGNLEGGRVPTPSARLELVAGSNSGNRQVTIYGRTSTRPRRAQLRFGAGVREPGQQHALRHQLHHPRHVTREAALMLDTRIDQFLVAQVHDRWWLLVGDRVVEGLCLPAGRMLEGNALAGVADPVSVRPG